MKQDYLFILHAYFGDRFGFILSVGLWREHYTRQWSAVEVDPT